MYRLTSYEREWAIYCQQEAEWWYSKALASRLDIKLYGADYVNHCAKEAAAYARECRWHMCLFDEVT